MNTFYAVVDADNKVVSNELESLRDAYGTAARSRQVFRVAQPVRVVPLSELAATIPANMIVAVLPKRGATVSLKIKGVSQALRCHGLWRSKGYRAFVLFQQSGEL